MIEVNKIYQGDCLEVLKTFPDNSIDCVVTSPPYWALRDYGSDGQLGLENTFQEYIKKLCDIFDEVKRVLKKDGTCWVNIGDTYGNSGKGAGGASAKSTLNGGKGLKETDKLRIMGKESWSFEKKPNIDDKYYSKCLCQIPSRFAIEMCNRGWILRNEIIWHKPNAMPNSVKDRFTVDFEKIFFFVKNKKYFFNQQLEPVKESTINRNKYTRIPKKESKNYSKINGLGSMEFGKLERNKRTVWSITTNSYNGAHFATYPLNLIETPIKSGCPENGIVLDPFMGSGTTALVAIKQNKNYIGIELNINYIKMANDRIMKTINAKENK